MKAQVGDIVRYNFGSTALMRVDKISPKHGGTLDRYYGEHCLGGPHGAYEDEVQEASEIDRKTWDDNARWRRPTPSPTDQQTSAVTDQPVFKEFVADVLASIHYFIDGGKVEAWQTIATIKRKCEQTQAALSTKGRVNG